VLRSSHKMIEKAHEVLQCVDDGDLIRVAGRTERDGRGECVARKDCRIGKENMMGLTALLAVQKLFMTLSLSCTCH
jgi:hypothetical protein